MGVKIDPAIDQIELDPSLQNLITKQKKNFVYLALNKPKGYVVSVTGPEKPKVMELLKNVEVNGLPVRIFPAGRLDKETSGLLLFTNDGRFAYEMTHPKFEKEKEYEVSLTSPISNGALEVLAKGVTIFKKATAKHRKGYAKKTSPSKVTRISAKSFRIVLREGINRQIRRMCRKIGFLKIEIKRIRVGKLALEDMREGKYRLLTKEEVLKYFGYK